MAHDVISKSEGSHSGTFSWTHTPIGVPSGVLAFVMRIDGSTAAISGVTYGGTAMEAKATAQDASGEQGLCKAYFLGSSVPTGAQTVQVTTTDGLYYAVTITVTSVGDTETAGVALLQGDGTLAEQSVDDGSPGADSLRYAAGFTGLNSPPSAGANSTMLEAIDDGTVCVVICCETTAGQGARSVGFSSGETNDRAFVHLAVSEIP